MSVIWPLIPDLWRYGPAARGSLFKYLVAIGVMIITLPGHNAWAQTARTIKVIVPAPPGGPADLLGRLLVDQIRRAQGPGMLIENRPGASSDIGTEAVARAAPDGTTLLIATNNLVITKHVRSSVTFDPLTSFDPICLLVKLPLLIVVNSSSPFGSLSDLLETARAHPGALTVAAFGPASPPHIALESLKRVGDVTWTYVPFAGDAPAVTALLGGHVSAVVAAYSSVMEPIALGKLRPLATTGRERIAGLPNVPSVAEYGGSPVSADYGNMDVTGWLGLLAPARTPQKTIEQLTGLFVSALQTPELNAKLLAQGLYPNVTCGAAFGARLKEDYEHYGRVIREANIKEP
jgi:tripartite-type tricarboxylate transporter receptor subunit TctC